MVNKKIFMFLLLVSALPHIQAQKAPQGSGQTPSSNDTMQSPSNPADVKNNYFISTEGKNSVFYQTLSWESIEDILHYEFELEKKNKNGNWQIIDKKKLKQNSIEVSLSHGSYRYRVKVINLLGLIDTVSAYRYFDILLAYQPETYSVSPKIISFDEDYSDIIHVTGKNFRDSTSFTLQKEGASPIHGGIVELGENGTEARIKFNIIGISPGTYTFIVTDPSGLKDSKENIIFRFQKPLDFYLSGGYVFTGFVGKSIFKTYFQTDFSALGGILRAGLVPLKRIYGRFGFNMTLSGMHLNHKEGEYNLSCGFMNLQLNGLYMYPIVKRRLNFDFHLGMGALFLVNTQFEFDELKSPSFWYWGLDLNLGTAFQVYVYKKLYIELNVDHIFPFRKGFPTYIIQPSISLGWEF